MRLLRTLPVPALLVVAGFTLAAAQDAPPAPKDDGGAAPAPPVPPFKAPAILAQRRKGVNEASANVAVRAGLEWLRRHARDDGRWDSHGFDAACPGEKCTEPGMPEFDEGVTALAVLAFLGAGRTHVEGDDAALVARALAYLLSTQDSEGCFGPRTSSHFQYNHHVATMAVAEALWLTGDERLLRPAAKARDFVLASRNPDAVWRYGVRDGDNDSSATAYAVTALRTCQFAGLDVPYEAYQGAHAWFDRMTDRSIDKMGGDTSVGRVGYWQRGGRDARFDPRGSPVTDEREPTPGSDVELPGGGKVRAAYPRRVSIVTRPPSDEGRTRDPIEADYPTRHWSALTAAAAFATTVTASSDQSERIEIWAAFISHDPPVREPSPGRAFLDLHCLLFGSLLHAQRPLGVRRPEDAAPRWRPFREAVVADLVATQRKKADGCAAGSWDASRDPFGLVGGRVYTTAMAVLALEAPNRFPKVWNPWAKPPEPARPDKK